MKKQVKLSWYDNLYFLLILLIGIIFLALIVSYLIGIIYFLISFDILFDILIAFLFIFSSIAYFRLLRYIIRRPYVTIQKSKLYQRLIEKGFEVENIQTYYGLVGYVDHFQVRVYYDWNKVAKGLIFYRDLVIEIYYHPVLKKNIEENEVDYDLLWSLNRKYGKKDENGSFYSFLVDRLMINMNYYP